MQDVNLQVFPNPPESSSRALLVACDLPTSDLQAGHFEHFLGCGTPDTLQGIVGLEIFKSDALLRSLAVAEEARGSGCGMALVEAIEDYARGQGVQRLYLLTTRAEKFFSRAGYEVVSRELAPESIRQTKEFSGLCLDDARFMMKPLEAT